MPLWIFFLHRSYSNKSNKIYFIFFAFFLEFIWNLQFIAEIKHKIIKIPPYPTDQRAPLVSGRGFFPVQPRKPQRARGAQAQGQAARGGGDRRRPARWRSGGCAVGPAREAPGGGAAGSASPSGGGAK